MKEKYLADIRRNLKYIASDNNQPVSIYDEIIDIVKIYRERAVVSQSKMEFKRKLRNFKGFISKNLKNNDVKVIPLADISAEYVFRNNLTDVYQAVINREDYKQIILVNIQEYFLLISFVTNEILNIFGTEIDETVVELIETSLNKDR